LSESTEKSVLKSIRISKKVADTLEESAKDRKISVNALISSILQEYEEWDRMVEKFSFLELPNKMVRRVFEQISQDTAVSLGDELGAELPKEIMLFWFKAVNPEALLNWLSLLSKYEKFSQLEVSHVGRTIKVIAHHELGKNWSVWLSHYLSGAVKSVIGVAPVTNITEGLVTLEFNIP
jgi:hypothetical protein